MRKECSGFSGIGGGGGGLNGQFYDWGLEITRES